MKIYEQRMFFDEGPNDKGEVVGYVLSDKTSKELQRQSRTDGIIKVSYC